MIEEQYISFETAQLAKEKGFNESISTLYKNGIFKHHKPRHSNNPFISNKGMTDNCCSAPTQSLLAMWLREKYNLHVGVGFCANWRYIIIPITDKIIANWSISEKSYSTYEEAMEIGLQEALKLI